MFPFIGLAIVICSVAGGYLWGGGHFSILWQPGEFLIIGGAALGSFLIANPRSSNFFINFRLRSCLRL